MRFVALPLIAALALFTAAPALADDQEEPVAATEAAQGVGQAGETPPTSSDVTPDPEAETVAVSDATPDTSLDVKAAQVAAAPRVGEAPATYTVHYDLSGGVASDTGLPSIDPRTGVLWTDANLLPSAVITRDGYDFVGWIVSAGGKPGVPVSAANSYADLAADKSAPQITLAVVWQPTSSASPIGDYRPSGIRQQGSGDPLHMDSHTVASDETETPTPTPTKEPKKDQPDEDILPATGFDTLKIALIAGAVIVVGAGALFIRRRH